MKISYKVPTVLAYEQQGWLKHYVVLEDGVPKVIKYCDDEITEQDEPYREGQDGICWEKEKVNYKSISEKELMLMLL